jgi:hypothetical protein
VTSRRSSPRRTTCPEVVELPDRLRQLRHQLPTFPVILPAVDAARATVFPVNAAIDTPKLNRLVASADTTATRWRSPATRAPARRSSDPIRGRRAGLTARTWAGDPVGLDHEVDVRILLAGSVREVPNVGVARHVGGHHLEAHLPGRVEGLVVGALAGASDHSGDFAISG